MALQHVYNLLSDWYVLFGFVEMKMINLYKFWETESTKTIRFVLGQIQASQDFLAKPPRNPTPTDLLSHGYMTVSHAIQFYQI